MRFAETKRVLIGIRFYDIKYKNETILYELGLEEAIAHYAGMSIMSDFLTVKCLAHCRLIDV